MPELWSYSRPAGTARALSIMERAAHILCRADGRASEVAGRVIDSAAARILAIGTRHRPEVAR